MKREYEEYCYLKHAERELDKYKAEEMMKRLTTGTTTALASVSYNATNTKGDNINKPDMDSDEEIDAHFGALMDMEIAVKPAEVTVSGSPEQCAATIRAYMEAGLDVFTLDFSRHGLDGYQTTLGQMDIFVEQVVPLLA